MSWRLVFTKHAKKDAKKLARSGLKPQAERILSILREDPYQTSPAYEKLIGDLSGACSRRINIQHRLVYQILDDIKTAWHRDVVNFVTYSGEGVGERIAS